MTTTEGPQQDPSLTAVLTEVLTELKQLRQEVQDSREEFQQEVKRWDERFFQLSRDTLNFTRTVVTTAAVVAVLIPLLKDVVPFVIEILKVTP